MKAVLLLLGVAALAGGAYVLVRDPDPPDDDDDAGDGGEMEPIAGYDVASGGASLADLPTDERPRRPTLGDRLLGRDTVGPRRPAQERRPAPRPTRGPPRVVDAPPRRAAAAADSSFVGRQRGRSLAQQQTPSMAPAATGGAALDPLRVWG